MAAVTDVNPTEIATVQLKDGTTYTFFFDKGTSPATLKYLIGPTDNATYSVTSIRTVNTTTAIRNSRPGALAAALQGDNIHVFYSNDAFKLRHIAFNLATKTWKDSQFVTDVVVATGSSISAVGEPVLKVHFVDNNDTKSISEAYYTERTWTSRKLSNL